MPQQINYETLPQELKDAIMEDLKAMIGPTFDLRRRITLPSRRLLDATYESNGAPVIVKDALAVDLYTPIEDLVIQILQTHAMDQAYVINYMDEYKATHTKIQNSYVMYPRYDVYFVNRM